MAPTRPAPAPRRRAVPLRAQRVDLFGEFKAAADAAVQECKSPDALALERVQELQEDEAQRNNAVVAIALAKPTTERRAGVDPFAVEAVIPRRPKTPYDIEEETIDAEVNRFFVSSFERINQDISQIAFRFFGRNYGAGNDESAFFKDMSPLLTPALRHYISFLADGDAGTYLAKEGWKTIFRNGQEREYLFRGILHKWLEDNVFGALLFGANEAQEGVYMAQERAFISENGYVRTRLRSETTIAILSEDNLPPNFNDDAMDLAQAFTHELYPIHALLRPHYTQDYTGHGEPDNTDPANPALRTKIMRGPPTPPADFGEPAKERQALLLSLRNLIEYAAYVHVIIRRTRHIVQIIPAFRGSPFTPEDHISDEDGQAYYRATKIMLFASDEHRTPRKAPSSFPPGIPAPAPAVPSFPVATRVTDPATGVDGIQLQYIPYTPTNSFWRASKPLLMTAAGAGFGIVGSMMAYTFEIDTDLPFRPGMYRGFAALPGNSFIRGAGCGAVAGAVASLPFSKAVAVAGTASGFMMGAVMGLVSTQGAIYHWNVPPEFDFNEMWSVSWGQKKAMFSSALVGALAGGLVRWVKNGIVVPDNSSTFLPQENLYASVPSTSLGIPILAEIATALVGFGATALADRIGSPSLAEGARSEWWMRLRVALVPLVSSGAAAFFSMSPDWTWFRLVVSTALGYTGGGLFENYASDGAMSWNIRRGGYLPTLPTSLIGATLATAAATSMRYRHEITRSRVPNIPPVRVPHYRCLIRIAVTPCVRLYKKGDGSNRRNAELNGQRIYEVQKATVLCYWGTENFSYYEGRPKITLDDFFDDYMPGKLSKLGSSIYNSIGSVFKRDSSTVGMGDNVIPPPPGAPGAEPGAGAGAGAGRQRRDAGAAPPQPDLRPQRRQGSGVMSNLRTSIRNAATNVATRAGDKISGAYRVTKRTAAYLRPTVPAFGQNWTRNAVLTAATCGVIALAISGAYHLGPSAKEAWDSTPGLFDLGKTAGSRVHQASDSIYSDITSRVGVVKDQVGADVEELLRPLKDVGKDGRKAFDAGKDKVKSGWHEGTSRVKDSTSKVKDQFEYVQSGASEAGRRGRDAINDVLDTEKVKSRWYQGTSRVKDSTSKVKDQLGYVQSGASEAGRRGRDAINEVLEDGKSRFDAGTSKLKDGTSRVKDQFGHVQSGASEAGRRGKDVITDAFEDTRSRFDARTSQVKDAAGQVQTDAGRFMGRFRDALFGPPTGVPEAQDRPGKHDAAVPEERVEDSAEKSKLKKGEELEYHTAKAKMEREERLAKKAEAMGFRKEEEERRYRAEKVMERMRNAAEYKKGQRLTAREEAALQKKAREEVDAEEDLDPRQKRKLEKQRAADAKRAETERLAREKREREQELKAKKKEEAEQKARDKKEMEEKRYWEQEERKAAAEAAEAKKEAEKRRAAEELAKKNAEEETRKRKAAEEVAKQKKAEESKKRKAADIATKKPKKPKVSPFMDPATTTEEYEIERNPKKRMYEGKKSSIFNWIGYRGGDNAMPSDSRTHSPPPTPSSSPYDRTILNYVGYRGGDNAIPGQKPVSSKPKLSSSRRWEEGEHTLGYRGGDNAVPGQKSAKKQKVALSRPGHWDSVEDDDHVRDSVGYRGGDNAVPDSRREQKYEMRGARVDEATGAQLPVETVYQKRDKARRARQEAEERRWAGWRSPFARAPVDEREKKRVDRARRKAQMAREF